MPDRTNIQNAWTDILLIQFEVLHIPYKAAYDGLTNLKL